MGELRSLTQATDETIQYAARTWPQGRPEDFDREGRNYTDRATGTVYRLVHGNPLLADDTSVVDLFVVEDGSMWFLSRADRPPASPSTWGQCDDAASVRRPGQGRASARPQGHLGRPGVAQLAQRLVGHEGLGAGSSDEPATQPDAPDSAPDPVVACGLHALPRTRARVRWHPSTAGDQERQGQSRSEEARPPTLMRRRRPMGSSDVFFLLPSRLPASGGWPCFPFRGRATL